MKFKNNLRATCHENGAHFNLGTKFVQNYNFGWISSIPSTIFIISIFHLLSVPNFLKIVVPFTFGTKFCKFVIFGYGHQFQLMYL